MKLMICAIRDQAVGAFQQPFFVRARGEAMRMFVDAVSDGKSLFCAHPEDYVLFEVGSFDDATGTVESVIVDKIMSGLEAKAVSLPS